MHAQSRAHVVAMTFVLAPLIATSHARAAEAELEATIQAALKQANPEYSGKGTFRFKDGRLIGINLMRCSGITDLSPFDQFELSSVSSVILYNATNVTDIGPLRRCRLRSLNLERCAKITDLTPLKGMPLTHFRMYACAGVKDLTPLMGMPLKHLDLGLNPQIADLKALKGLPLEDLRIDNCPKVTDISVLDKMPIKLLSIFGNKAIKDYSALSTLKLETLYFTPSLLNPDDLEPLRNMKSLTKLGTSWADFQKEHKPAVFWNLLHAGELKNAK